MAATDYNYIDYANAAGQVKRLPVAPGTACSARPAPGDLTPQQIASMIADLPTPPVGKKWQKKNCVIGDGPWVLDNDNPPGFIPDTDTTSPVDAPIGDQSGNTPIGYVTTNQPVQTAQS